MWKCPNCKTTNEINICRICGFDASKDYTNHRSLCQLSKSGSKIFKPAKSGDNILMASSDTDYVFGRKMDRKQITTIYFRSKKENIDEDAWDVSEKQNGSIMAWTKEAAGLLDLYIAANGTIVANRNCNHLFSDYGRLEHIYGLEYLKTDQTQEMFGMFKDCNSLKNLDVSRFDTSQVKNMGWMFAECGSLESLDVGHFDTSQVKGMKCMFYKCSSLKSLDVSRFVTNRATDLSFMFSNCDSLENLDVSRFYTSQVKEMKYMF